MSFLAIYFSKPSKFQKKILPSNLAPMEAATPQQAGEFAAARGVIADSGTTFERKPTLVAPKKSELCEDSPVDFGVAELDGIAEFAAVWNLETH